MSLFFTKILRCGIAVIFSLSSVAIAKTEVPIQRNTPVAAPPFVSVKEALKGVKKFTNFKDFFLFADALVPGKGYDKWAQYSDKSGLSKNVKIEEVTAEGMKIYLPGIKEPFEFSNDGETIIYKEVSVKLKKHQTPESTAQELKKAWGGFSEFKPKKVSNSFLKYWFLPEAFADGQGEALNDWAAGSLGYVAVGALWAAAEAIGLAFVSTVGFGVAAPLVGISAFFYSVYAVAKYIWFLADKKGNEVKDASLQCNGGVPYLAHGTEVDNLPFEGLKSDEVEQAKKALAEICKNPEVVKSFNDSMYSMKKKIFSGDISFFAADAKARSSSGGGQLMPGQNGIQ